jgi:hypothetical protein
MSSKSFVKLLRKVIREEVRAAVTEILTEQTTNHKQVINHGMQMAEMSDNPKRKKKVYSKNSMLNDILNETAGLPSDGPLVSQGNSEYPSMNNFKSAMAETYGRGPAGPVVTQGINGEPVNMQNENVAATVNAMTKDYSGVMAAMKKMDKSKGKRVI